MSRWTLAVCCLVALCVRNAEAQHALAALPLDDPAYFQLEGLAHGGCRAARVSAFRPYLIGWIRSAIEKAQSEDRCRGPLLDALRERFTTVAADSTVIAPTFGAGAAITAEATALHDAEFRPLWRDVRPKALGTPPVVVRVHGRASWNGGPRLFGVVDAYAVTNRRNDPTLRGRGFRGSEAVVDFEEASLSGLVGPLDVTVGRGPEAWLAEGRESMMLSANGPPLDRIAAGARSNRWQLRALIASMPDVVLTSARDSITGTPRRFHRMLAAHAISALPVPGLELVLGETALVTREGGGTDLAFANPMMVYLVTQNDTGYTGEGASPANLTTFGSARWSVGRLVIGGELTVDDIQIDPKDRKNIPDQLAWRVSATQGVPLVWPANVGVEYRHVDSYTYLRSPYSAVYQQYDAPIGSELGPDADELRLTTEVFVSSRLRLEGSVGHRRQGALRLEERPSHSAFGHASEPYPSTSASRPAVQTVRSVGAGIQWLDRTLPLTARLEWAGMTNINNTPATSANYLRVNIVGSYRLRYP